MEAWATIAMLDVNREADSSASDEENITEIASAIEHALEFGKSSVRAAWKRGTPIPVSRIAHALTDSWTKSALEFEISPIDSSQEGP